MGQHLKNAENREKHIERLHANGGSDVEASRYLDLIADSLSKALKSKSGSADAILIRRIHQHAAELLKEMKKNAE